MRRAVTSTVTGAGLVLALGACSGGDGTGTEDESGAEDGTSQTDDADPSDDAVMTDDSDAATVTEGAAGPASDEVAAAREGLAAWLTEHRPETPQTSTNLEDCPAIDLERLEEALGSAGFPDTTLGSWGTEIEWSEYQALHPELMGLTCGGDSDGDANDSDYGTAAGVFAVDVQGTSDFEAFLAATGLSDGESVDPPEELGGEVRTQCFEDEPEFCVALWHEDGLILGTSLIAEGADEDAVESLLGEVLPDMLEGLAEA